MSTITKPPPGSGNSTWPPALKAYVNSTFAACTDANRTSVEAELKGLILAAFNDNKLWEIDWSKTVLKSLQTDANGGLKKRKAFVPSVPASYGVISSTSPHLQQASEESSLRAKRARRFVPPTSTSNPSSASSLSSRFGYSMMNSYATPEPEVDPNVLEWDKDTIIGTSNKLEKNYLRLTSAPDPSTIRPLSVLKKTLELLKKKWREEANYPWVCDQFKSLRQDLTVQRIKNDFTCTVYEIHARIALEKGELGEFNQCLARLNELYERGLPGHDKEFMGYRILYLIHTRNRAEMNNLLSTLPSELKSDPSISHALKVRKALSRGDYITFFRLFVDAPKMGAYLMDHFVPRERVSALCVVGKAYKSIPLTFLVEKLAFENIVDAEIFLKENGVESRIKDQSLVCDEFVREKFGEAKGKFIRTGAGAV